MSYVIAVVGKGGVGKTTLSGILVQYLSHRDGKSVLAVDADSNSNLNEVLGLVISGSLGEIREEISNNQNELQRNLQVKGIEDYTLSKMDEAITKGDGYDILVMGRPQGAGCYCFANEILRRQIERIEDNYTYVLVDNEAGMEHISRGLLPRIDVVIIVSDKILTCTLLMQTLNPCGRTSGTLAFFVYLLQDSVRFRPSPDAP